MERFKNLRTALPVLLLMWMEVLPCRAQPAAEPSGAGAARNRSDTLPEQAPRPDQDSSQKTQPARAGEVVDLKLPPLEAGDVRFPINLAAALRLADARPVIVVAAQAGTWVAEAQLQKADSVPTLNWGLMHPA